jgi:putative copper export protein
VNANIVSDSMMNSMILIFHILAATIWTGGHLILALLILPKAIREKNVKALLEFEQGYEKIGIPALIVQVASGLWLAYQLQPNIIKWFTFEDFISTHIGIKLGLLAITAIIALDARLRIIPKLNTDRLSTMAWHIIPVTILSIMFVIAGVALRSGGY